MTITISGFDLKPYALLGGYQINNIEEYQDWTDGWGTTHRDVIRKKVGGKMELFFKTLNEYLSFVSALEQNRQESGAYPCTLTVNNQSTDVVCNCFLTFKPKRTQKGDGADHMESFELEVEER